MGETSLSNYHFFFENNYYLYNSKKNYCIFNMMMSAKILCSDMEINGLSEIDLAEFSSHTYLFSLYVHNLYHSNILYKNNSGWIYWNMV